MSQSYRFEPLTETLKGILELSNDVATAAPLLLRTLAKCLDGEWAAYWKLNSDEQVLRAIETWSDNSEPLRPLLRETETRALTISEGAPGRVWNSGHALSTVDLITVMRLPRSLYAKAAGFSSGIWFPIRYQSTTRGVIELLRRQSWPDDEHFLKHLIILGETIGEMLPKPRSS